MTTITWHPRGDIPGIAPSSSSGLVEIINPKWSPLGGSQEWGAYLVLSFWDESDIHLPGMQRVIADRLGANRKLCLAVGSWCFASGGWAWRPFIAADVADLHGFRDQAKALSLQHIHVSCEYGRSRSRAVAEWLANELGATAIGNLKGRPNSRMVRLLESGR